MRNVKAILFLGFGLLQAQQASVMSGVNSVENGVFVN